MKCLQVQKKINPDMELKENCFQCKFCNQTYSRFDILKRHEDKYCQFKQGFVKNQLDNQAVKNELEALRQENIILKTTLEGHEHTIKLLQNQLLEKERNQQSIVLAALSKPMTVKNTVMNTLINNLVPLKEEEMIHHAAFLTIDHIKEGPEGYAKFALSRPFKDRVTCTDVSRKKLAWKNDEGSIVYDNEGQKLSEKFFRIMKDRNEVLFRELINDLGTKLSDAYKRDDQEEADAIVDLTDKIQTWRREAYKASKGTLTDLSADFARALCKISSSVNY